MQAPEGEETGYGRPVVLVAFLQIIVPDRKDNVAHETVNTSVNEATGEDKEANVRQLEFQRNKIIKNGQFPVWYHLDFGIKE